MQRGLTMKSMIVGMLAAVALMASGCGVGMDDLEGEQAANGTSTAALLNADNTRSAQGEMRGQANGDPRVQLPQDPIPVFEARTVGSGRPTK